MMKKDWTIKKLGEVCEVIAGQSPEGKFYNQNHNGTPFYQGKKDFGEKYLEQPTVWTTLETKIALKNDILMSVRAPVGDINICNQRICIGRGLAAIRPSNKTDKDFLFYYLLSEKPKIKGKEGAVFASINRSEIAELKILLPPLEEQKRIVAVLDKKFAQIETLKTAAEKNLQNTKQLFQSELEKAFSNTSWERVLLSEIALDFSRGKSKHRPRNDKILFGGDYPFIQTGDIRNSDKYVTEYIETYNESGLAQSKLWPEGTLCITIAANIAETAILTFPCCFPDSIIGFIPNEKRTTVDYIYYVIQFFKAELQKLSKGAAQDNLNLAKLESMKFPLPPLEEQKRIVAHLDSLSEKVHHLEEIYTKQLADCDELKQSLLQKAFEGEL